MTDKKLFGIGGGSGRLNWQKSEKTYNSKILKYTQFFGEYLRIIPLSEK